MAPKNKQSKSTISSKPEGLTSVATSEVHSASNSFNAVNNPEYFKPPAPGTFGRMAYDYLNPLVINYECHVTSVQRFFGLPSRSAVLAEAKLSNSPAKVPKSKYFGVDFIMRAASELGNELFYGLWAVFLAIFIDMEAAQTMVTLWVLAMYIGQFFKDVCRLPRPGLCSKSEILRLDSHYAAEYGFPSTHTACACSQPAALLYFILTRYDISSSTASPIALFFVAAFCLFWFLVTPISRLYLGVHSSVDLLGGYFIGFGLLFPVLYFQPLIFPFLASPLGAISVFLFLIATLATYPRPKDHWTSSPGDTAIVSGAGCGILIGFALREVFNTSPAIYRIVTLPSTIYGVITVVIQLPIGLAVAYGMRHAVKPFVKIVAEIIATSLYGKPDTNGILPGKNSGCKLTVEERTVAKRFFMELCDKGSGYFTMGFMATTFFNLATDAIGWTYQLPSPVY